MAQHPKVTLDVILADRVIDLVEEGFDMPVRISRLPNSSLDSRPLTSARLVPCTSPAYLHARGRSTHPCDLVSHDVLAYSLLSMGAQRESTGSEGAVPVKVTPRMRTNNCDTCRVAALRHQGLELRPTLLVGPDMLAGKQMEAMPA